MRQCNPADLFRPQWAYPTPEGFRDEDFIMGPYPLNVLFNGMLALNFPVQLDDDVNYYIRGIILDSTAFGTEGQNAPGCFIRIRDCYGNPLSDGLVLAMGIWANQRPALNSFGFPVEPEVECSPGGTMLFDFQATSNGSAAEFDFVVGGDTLSFVSAIGGVAGDGASIHLVNPGAPNVPLSVAVVGRAVTVTLATNGGSAIVTTFAQLQNIINTTPAVQAVMWSTFAGTPADVVTALALTVLTGGINGSPELVYGCFFGVKRFPEC